MKTDSLSKTDLLVIRFLQGAVIVGVAVTFINLINNRGLWLDEAMLSLNIVKKSYMELLDPLDMNQVAPIGYLWLVKTFVVIFGDHEWALRLPSFLFYLGNIILIYLFGRRFLGKEILIWMICAIFSLNFRTAYYAVEVKQYEGDVFYTLLLIHLCLRFCDQRNLKYLMWLVGVGTVGLWFSNVVVLVLFTIGVLMLMMNIRDGRKFYEEIWIPGVLWLVSFSIYYYLFIHNHPTREFMLAFWYKWHGFFVVEQFFSKESAEHLLFVVREIFEKLLVSYIYWPFFLVLYIIGFLRFRLYEKEPLIKFLFVFPILLHLGLSAFMLYPFSTRLILYLYPFILIMLIYGYGALYYAVKKTKSRLSVIIIVLPVLITSIIHIARFPLHREEIKEAMLSIYDKSQPGDDLYVYCNSYPTFAYYLRKEELAPLRKRFDSAVIGQPHSELIGLCDYTDIVEMDAPFWVIFSSITPYDVGDKVIRQEVETLNLLRKNRFVIGEKLEFEGVDCYRITKR